MIRCAYEFFFTVDTIVIFIILGVRLATAIVLGSAKTKNSVFELNNAVTDGLIVMMGPMNATVSRHAATS